MVCILIIYCLIFVVMKFKQKIALSLAVFYAVSVIGLALSFHFCGGKLENVNLLSNEVSCKFCKEIPAKKKLDNNCCKNTSLTVKVKDSHQSEAQTQLPKLFSFELFTHFQNLKFLSNLTPVYFSKNTNKAPPLSIKVALHVFNCIFRN